MIKKNALIQSIICLSLSMSLLFSFDFLQAISFVIGGFTAILLNFIFARMFFSVPSTAKLKQIYTSAIVAIVMKWLFAILLVSVVLMNITVDYKFYAVGFIVLILSSSFLVIFLKYNSK